jgi:hypothetical protein
MVGWHLDVNDLALRGRLFDDDNFTLRSTVSVEGAPFLVARITQRAAGQPAHNRANGRAGKAVMAAAVIANDGAGEGAKRGTPNGPSLGIGPRTNAAAG